MNVQTEFEPAGPRALIECARDAANELTSALVGTVLPQDAQPGYRIVREVHRGGQGVVYRGVRLATGRQVAIKVMRDGPFGGPRDTARFEREVRILAQLRHPNIVGIHDRGEANGCHFFVMDYISGLALDEYLEDRRPSLSERLELFIKICHAIHAAHLRGVIHRDLKPTNVRIDERGEPHVLDFGLAKESDPLLGTSSRRAMTITGQFLGSLPWASPEQAGGSLEGIDLRTDVYSLGIMLFYALTQRFPYPVTGPMHEVFTHILESSPAQPRTFSREFDADLEVIVLKALEKDPARRYQSAADLAADLRRYLQHEPIAARPPSMAYQFRAFARRNRALVVGIVAVFIALVLGMVGTTWQARRARQEADTAQAIKEFLINDLLASGKPELVQGRKVTVEEVLANATRRIDGAFKQRPETEAAIRATLGQVYMSLGLYPEAEKQFKVAVSLLSETHGAMHPETLGLRSQWIGAGLSCSLDWNADEATEAFLQDCQGAMGETHELTIHAGMQRALALASRGNWAAGVQKLSEVLDTSRRVYGEDHPLTIGAHTAWAEWTLRTVARRAELESMLRESLDRSRRALGADHPDTFQAMVNLGSILSEQRRFAEAEPFLREGYDGLRRVLGETNPRLIGAMCRLALQAREKGLVREAIALSRRAASIARSVLGDDNPTTLEAKYNLGTSLFRCGCHCEAEEVSRELLETYRRTQGDDSMRTAHLLEVHSLGLMKLGRYTEAEAELRQADEALIRNNGVGDAWGLRQLILALAALGRPEEARPFAERLLEMRREPALLPDADAYALNSYAYDLLTVHPTELRDPSEGLRVALLGFERSDDEYHFNRFTLALAYEANELYAEAIEFARRALAHSPLEHSTERADYEAILVRCLEQTGDMEGAEQVYRDTLAARRIADSANDHDVSVSLFDLGNLLLKHGKHAKAEPVLQECLDKQQELLGERDDLACPLTLDCELSRTMMSYGNNQLAKGDYVNAELYLVEAYDRFSRSTACHVDYLPENAKLLIDLYNNSGRPDHAMRYTTALSESAQHIRP